MEILVSFEDPRGYVKYVTTEAGETWALLGECNRCGECCEKTKMPVPEFRDKNGHCKHFKYEKQNGKELGACNIFWGRPSFCLLYPRDPGEKLPGPCGYKWEKVN